MVRILVINPNSTASMTASIEVEARRAASPGTEIVAVNPTASPPAIQGAADGEAAIPHVIDLFTAQTAQNDYDAAIVACFDDTGLWALRARSDLPVLGIGEAGFYAAMMLARRFSVVTTLPISVPVIEANIEAYGIAPRCAQVRASDVPVLDLETRRAQSLDKIRSEIDIAIRDDGCDAIVLGCAGMADAAKSFEAEFAMPVIDGVKAAVGFGEGLVAMRTG